MLRWLLQNLETSLGPSLAPAARLLYWGALALLLFMVARLWWSGLMARATARAGLVRGWTGPCPTCSERQPLRGGACARCGTSLGLPWALRLHLVGTGGPGWLRRAAELTGAGAFTLTSVLLLLTARVWAPDGDLHRLFLGLAVLGFALVGGALSGMVGGSGRGVLSRAGSGLQAMAALGLAVVALLLADQSRPAPQVGLLRFTVSEAGAQVNGRMVPLLNGEVAVDYFQLDQASLGLHHVVPLALSGRERVELAVSGQDRWLMDWLVRHAEALETRGFTVRQRTDRRTVAPGGAWELRDVGGQVGVYRVRGE
jgi:hypothetical protein